MIRHLILDWAGTLADDRALTLAATCDTLAHFGAAPVDEATYRREFTLPVERFYRRFIGERPREEIDAVFFRHFATRMAQSQLFADVPALLHICRLRGVALSICSSVPTAILDELLTRLGLREFFRHIGGGAADKIPVLQQIVAESGFRPDETLYVGDTPHDIDAAHAAGVIAGAALYGYATEERLRAARPDHAFASVREIIDLIDREHLLASERRVIATVGGLLVANTGELLLIRTAKWSGRWGLPGGKVDYGETLLAAYRREMREETGIDVDHADWLCIQDCIESPEFTQPRHFLLINYVSRLPGRPTPRKNYESLEIGWFAPAVAAGMDLNQPTRAALELATQRGFVTLPRPKNTP
ncbi:HAD hydrolase-like protein [Immundisolibacter sp.]|uniref:HAD hydrolase-like protein n=1 Tax=Immundisolibacter sp. TaxID=1934948 RepID=UPI002618587E|nr:HAD hydrolase-like protein [Immundisolibacter sp.]MDD3651260.1 HAD hydrolase-like protein [Immundisolibacter sp.]